MHVEKVVSSINIYIQFLVVILLYFCPGIYDCGFPAIDTMKLSSTGDLGDVVPGGTRLQPSAMLIVAEMEIINANQFIFLHSIRL